MAYHELRPFVAHHWFIFVAPIVLLANVVVAMAGPIDRLVEAGMLVDLVIVLPVLYVLCYRKKKRGTGARALGLACLGVWVATKLVPEVDRGLLLYIEPLRYAGFAVLVFLEIAIIRLVFRSLAAGYTEETVAKSVADESEMPDWVAKLLVWEAGLWRTLYASVRRILGRPGSND